MPAPAGGWRQGSGWGTHPGWGSFGGGGSCAWCEPAAWLTWRTAGTRAVLACTHSGCGGVGGVPLRAARRLRPGASERLAPGLRCSGTHSGCGSWRGWDGRSARCAQAACQRVAHARVDAGGHTRGAGAWRGGALCMQCEPAARLTQSTTGMRAVLAGARAVAGAAGGRCLCTRRD